jgi:trimethylamine---corrinoid protein Co-methyltransferase
MMTRRALARHPTEPAASPARYRPRVIFRLLSDDHLERIHSASLEILRDPGIEVTTEEARSLLLGAGCTATDGDTISLPPGLVERAIASAPRAFDVFDREGRPAIRLGVGEGTHFSPGVTALNLIDPATGEARPFSFRDIADVARLGDALPNMSFVTTPGVVRATETVPQPLVNQYEFLAMVTNTTKPLVVLIADGQALGDVLEMAAAVAGGRERLRRAPFVMPYLNPVSPLLFNPETLDKLLLAAEWGIPVILQSAPQVGATSPVTYAGAAALSNAESLAGLVLAQLRREGAPFITGAVPMVVDMRTGNASSGGPLAMSLVIAAAELARMYGLPCLGIGGGGDAKLDDEQAFLESAFYAFGAMLGGVDLVFDVGNTEAGLAHSPTVVAVTDEMIGMLRRGLAGFEIDEENLALESIRAVGIGETYLGQPHTLRHFRELWTPSLLSIEDRKRWTDEGGSTLRDRARARVATLVQTHEVPPLPPDVVAAMAAVLDARRRAIAG